MCSVLFASVNAGPQSYLWQLLRGVHTPHFVFCPLLMDTRFGSVSVIVPVDRAAIDVGVQRSLRPKLLSLEYTSGSTPSGSLGCFSSRS